MEIRIDDLRGPEIAALLTEHLECMAQVSPPESRHALDLEQLRQPSITFWTVWDGRQLAGCAALKEIDSSHGEVKSMRTAKSHLRQGVARRLLEHIIAEAQQRGYRRLSLETGSMPYFEPARSLYRGAGFKECVAFVGYKPDPTRNFFTLEI
jgi:putative acetyltransferase